MKYSFNIFNTFYTYWRMKCNVLLFYLQYYPWSLLLTIESSFLIHYRHILHADIIQFDICIFLNFFIYSSFVSNLYGYIVLIFRFLYFGAVLDDEDTSFTDGCIVTVFVNLKRQMMKVLFNKKELSHIDEDQDNIAIKIEDKEFNEDPVRNI